MRSSLVSLGRRLPELTTELAALAALAEGPEPDEALATARAIAEKVVLAICKEDDVPVDATPAVLIDRLVDRHIIPGAIASPVRAVCDGETTLPGDAVDALVGFLEFRIGSRTHLRYQPTRRGRPRWLVPALVAAIAAAGLAIVVVAWPAPRPPATATTAMIAVPGGTFEMGSREAELAEVLAMCRDVEHRGEYCQVDNDALAQEQPRTVTVSAFELDEHEVTVADFVAWLEREPRSTGEIVVPTNVDYDRERRAFSVRPERARLPIAGVSWVMARDYCAGVGKRLPTEAEWELAARGTERRRFPWGDALPRCDDVVFARAVERLCDRAGPWSNDPVDVGAAPGDVTPEGVHDLGGNVAEWTADAAGTRPRCAGPCLDPRIDGPPTAARVVRGGSFDSWPSRLRGAARFVVDLGYTRTSIGFRCAR